MTAQEAIRAELRNALELQRAGKHSAAQEIYERLLAQYPDLVPVLCLLANLQRQGGNLQRAGEYLQRARELAPDTPAVMLESGLLALAQDDPEQAVVALSKLVAARPDYAEGQFNLGHALERTFRAEQAITAYRAALQNKVAQPWEAHTRLGSCLVVLGREQDALGHFELALADAPDYAPALFGKGMVRMAYGEFAAAGELFDAALLADPERIEILQQLAELRKFDSMDEPVVHTMQALLAETDRDDYSKEKLNFGLGKIANDCGQYDTAFQHYAAAKTLKKQRQPRFERTQFLAHTQSIAEAFPALPELPSDGIDDSLSPVFIIGMPRSGTTLVEQILSSHSSVDGAGELSYMEGLARELGDKYPQHLASQSNDWIRNARTAYIDELQKYAKSARLVSDKYPANFLHVGLICKLFPEARFIHCRRNPLDTCLSIYFQDFSTGNYYANDLDDIAFYYSAYRKLMAHWQRVGNKRIHALEYEELVDDPQAVSTTMLRFLDLDWEPACSQFHKNPRKVSTMSRWQVRQPVYKGSRDRWRHYEAHLGPLIKGLPADNVQVGFQPE